MKEWLELTLRAMETMTPVINPEKKGIKGYVGGNTLIEIGVAFFLKKPIYILNEVSSELSYKVEILGMKSKILNGVLKIPHE